MVTEGKDALLVETAPVFERLLAMARAGRDVTVRDDEYDFSVLLDAVRVKARGIRFRLVDTGRWESSRMEWLVDRGADLYTADTVGRPAGELEGIQAICRRAGAVLACFLQRVPEEEREGTYSPSEVVNLARSGVYIHVTNRKEMADPHLLADLAAHCRRGGSRLIYYHHGPLEHSLVELGRNGAWVHLYDRSLEGEENAASARDLLRGASAAGGGLVIHWKKGMSLSFLDEMLRSGARVVFGPALFDFKSPYRALEKKARRKTLDFRTYYLSPTVLP